MVAFIGIHIPLLGMCSYYLFNRAMLTPIPSMLLILGLTLVATAVTLSVQNKLLRPLLLAKNSLDGYLTRRDVPDLPTHFTDEAGQLLANINITIKKLDTLLLEKSGMVDMLSHDLRSPLNRIVSLADLIKLSEGEEITQMSDLIIQECHATLALLQNFLETLKQEEVHLTSSFKPQRVGLKELVMGATTSFDFAASRKGIRWDISIGDDVAIYAEPMLFSQAVKNILSNAIKFSPENSTVTIDGNSGTGCVLLSVRDAGAGIDPADCEKIFTRFTGAGKTGTHGEGSTGLGLHISRRIVERHGGTIVAQSDPVQKGATFTITLPYRERPAA